MESRAKLLGHPIHPMLIVFPLGLLGMAVIFDALYLATGNQGLGTAAYWNITAGLVAGVIAAIPGFLDWVAIPGQTRAKQIGALHGFGNGVVLVLFFASWLQRQDAAPHLPTTLPFVLELVGVGLALWTGWLGGELVDRLGVGVDTGAHLDSPSSLSGRPADENHWKEAVEREAQVPQESGVPGEPVGGRPDGRR
jgi:uncharacterized membrane protein